MARDKRDFRELGRAQAGSSQAGVPPVIGPGSARLPRRRVGALWVGMWVVALGAAAWLLYWFPPDRYGFYPRCWLHELTGLQCPGCGGLRAVHRLLHGQLAAAWRLNPLVYVVGGWGVSWAVARWAGRWVGRRWADFFQCPAWGWGLLVLGLVFGILRNVPLAALAGLSN